MDPRTKSVLVVMLAGVWLVVGFGTATAATPIPTQETEAVTEGPVAGQPTSPSAANPEQAASREPGKPAGTALLLLPGRTVRVSCSSAQNDDEQQVEGTLVDADEDSLRIRRGNRVVTLPWPTVRRVEVAMTQGPSWQWISVGAGPGAGLGLVLAVTDWLQHTSANGPVGRTQGEADRAFALRVLGGLAVGTAIGTLISYLHPRPTGWTDAPLERVRVSLVPAIERRGFGLAITVSF